MKKEENFEFTKSPPWEEWTGDIPPWRFRNLTCMLSISAKFDVRLNVVPPWRARQAHSRSKLLMTSQNVNSKQSRKVRLMCFLFLFCEFLDKNEKNNQSPYWRREMGILSSCPWFAASSTHDSASLVKDCKSWTLISPTMWGFILLGLLNSQLDILPPTDKILSFSDKDRSYQLPYKTTSGLHTNPSVYHKGM